jgi:hypothetical protein
MEQQSPVKGSAAAGSWFRREMEKNNVDLPDAGGWSRENFFADGNYISDHTILGGVFLRKKCEILWVLVENEATGDNLVICFTRGLGRGVVDLASPALVDLTRFTGAVDWAAIRAVKDMAVWGRGARRKTRVAYLVRDGQFAALVKIIAALFPRSSHRAFYRLDEAVAWLLRADAAES